MAKKAKSKSKGRTDKGKKLESAENTKKSKFLINDIFKTLKTTSHTNTSKASTKPSTKSIVKEKSKGKRGKTEEYCTVNGDSARRRTTVDNLPIYTMEELNIGKGGGTELCPFDCNCCF
ncbi:uncharacterized protein TOT_010001188 [Theileria orientalis strain Shintoku]|uniref:DUF1764 domain-containing protein n=1 Tax=Theileria orientalis strain Shintoku TaxID=869250 RepID=J4C7J0_THEOR|nr:uncharacterized protein TOT_010001188 [Theileria orientalis strain Shintoku]BAM39123.1 uncharacterized protein TOT_010001188 [Theileria orientalis strain Shintoku]|eukprot:XP_009689424.1 uncharacterized protein TOT_010001188 [Theileria orientalis strain Shintoku]